MFFRQRQSTGATAGSAAGRSGQTATQARELQGYGFAAGVNQRVHVSPAGTTQSSWDRYAAMAPRETDSAVTYRVGHRKTHRGASTAHAYTAEPSHVNEAGGHGTGSSTPDHYALLGVERHAPGEQIERVYRLRVARLHPDKFAHDPVLQGQAQEKLKQLNAAMMDLRDPERRARYNSRLIGDSLPPLARRLQGSMPRYLS